MEHLSISARPSLGPRIPARIKEISTEARITRPAQTQGFLKRALDGGSRVRTYAMSTNTNRPHREAALMKKESVAQLRAVVCR